MSDKVDTRVSTGGGNTVNDYQNGAKAMFIGLPFKPISLKSSEHFVPIVCPAAAALTLVPAHQT
jgi:hypothetical protein